MSSESLLFDCTIQARTIREGEHVHRSVTGEITAHGDDGSWTFASSEIDHYRVGETALAQLSELWQQLVRRMQATAIKLGIAVSGSNTVNDDQPPSGNWAPIAHEMLTARQVTYPQLVALEQDWARFQVELAELGQERIAKGEPDKPGKPGKPDKPDHPHKDHPGKGHGRA